MMLIIILVVFGAIVAGVGYMVYSTMKKTNPNNFDTTIKDNISTAQEFLPFDDIKDGMILLGGHKYRAVIEASSTNYNLKTDKEKELIEISFQRFLNSLTFPISFYIQTKVIDNSKMLTLLEEELKDSIKQFPNLSDYANNYFNEMTQLNAYIGNNKQKKKYIIVSFEDALNMQNLNEEEKYEYSAKELYTRANIISEGLSSVGVKTKILNTEELFELVYSTYHKDNYSQVDNITNGEFLTLMTEGKNSAIEKVTDDATLDWILYEAQVRIQTELLNDMSPEFIRNSAQESIVRLDAIRNDLSGYYKEKNSIVDEYELVDTIDNFESQQALNYIKTKEV